MAKLTDVPVVTSLDDADLIYAVDVSDTTDDPAGTSVGITKANFQAGLGGGGTTKTRAVKTEIGRITDPGTGSFTFSGLSLGEYDRIEVKGEVRAAGGGSAIGLQLYLNGDTTGANYHTQILDAYNGAVDGSEVTASSSIGVVTAVGSTAGRYGTFKIEMENPGGSNAKVALGSYTSDRTVDEISTGSRAVAWDNTAAVTEIQVTASEDLLGTLVLYGEKTEEIGGGSGGETVDIEGIIEIDSQTVSGGKFDFTGLDLSEYDQVWLEMDAKSSAAGNSDSLRCFINNDTTLANYHLQQAFADNGTWNNSEGDDNPGVLIAAGSSAFGGTFGRIDFLNFKNDGEGVVMLGSFSINRTNGDHISTGNRAASTSVTGAITQITLQADGDPTETLTGTAKLLGRKRVSVGAGGGTAPTLIPVVQSMLQAGDALSWSTESGWGLAKVTTGEWDVTFPTDSGDLLNQAVTANGLSGGAITDGHVLNITNLTSTGCRVVMWTDAGAKIDGAWSLQRTTALEEATATVLPTPAGQVVKEEIGRITNPGTGEFDFVVPSGYDRLIMHGVLRSSEAAETDGIWVEYNGDTLDTNYEYQQSSGQDGAANANSGAPGFLGVVPGTTAPAGVNAQLFWCLDFPDSAAVRHTSNSTMSTSYGASTDGTKASIRNAMQTWEPATPAAVTSLKVSTEAAANLTGTLILYGERTV